MSPNMRREEPVMGGTSILQKLLAVMKDCGYIQKDKENTFHRYWYASEAAIKDKVHKSLVEHGVIPQFSLTGLTEREIPRQGKASEWLTTANVYYKFSCVDTGEFVDGTFYGCGIDPSDKGLYKAVTGAIKYILTSQFLIATGDDPENDEGRTASKEEKQGKQQDYLRSKGIEPTIPEKHRSHQPPPDVRTASDAHKALIVETAKMLDEPPQVTGLEPYVNTKTIEMRHAATVAEADAVLTEVKKPKKGKTGFVSFEVLKHFGLIKQEMRDSFGDDTAYYTVLKGFGYDHANAISDDNHARGIYKVLATERNRLKQEKELLGTLEHASEVLGARNFAEILGTYGAETIPDVLGMNGDALAPLLTALKTYVDLKNQGGAA